MNKAINALLFFVIFLLHVVLPRLGPMPAYRHQYHTDPNLDIGTNTPIKSDRA